MENFFQIAEQMIDGPGLQVLPRGGQESVEKNVDHDRDGLRSFRMAGVGGKMFEGEIPQLRKDDLPVFEWMVEFEKKDIQGFQDSPIPGNRLLEDSVLGVHGDLIHRRLFQVDAQGVGIEKIRGGNVFPANAIGVRRWGVGGHGRSLG